MDLENKTAHVTFRVSKSFASVIKQCVKEQGYKNKSEMLRELFSKEVEKSNSMEVKAQLIDNAKG